MSSTELPSAPATAVAPKVSAVRVAAGERLRSVGLPGVTLTAIGECVEQGLWLEEQGQRRPLPPHGYVHALE